eukprot:scaffold4351_cov99-Amphora_coffeaeformis.AAC.1
MNLKLQSDIAIDQEFRKLNTSIEGRPVWQETNDEGDSPLVELTNFANDLVKDQWDQSCHYHVKREIGSDHLWYVRHREEASDYNVKVLHPIWRRTWV